MRIIHNNESIFVNKPDGTSVNYYLFPEYEVHINKVKPGCIQVWHSHTKVEETIIVIEGEITALWIDDSGIAQEQSVCSNDMVIVGRSFHTFENRSEKMCKFIVIKTVSSGKNYSEIFKNDKELK